MIEFMPYFWAGVTLLAIVVECIVGDLVTIWFIPAGAVAVIISLLPFNVPVWLQVLIFFATAIVLLILSKTIWKKLFEKKPLVKTNLDAVVGKEALVVEKIDNIEGKGAVKVMGKVWSAVSEDGAYIEENELVTVKEIRGVKLVCIKK